jgi:acetyltransferase EpsM
MKRLVILGGPGDGLVVAEAAHVAQAAGAPYVVSGFLNDQFARGMIIQGVPVLGRFEDWQELSDDHVFVPATQKVQDMPRRVHRLVSLGIPEHRWGSVRHPMSAVASDAVIGIGTFIASGVTIQPAAIIGAFSSIRAGASIGHHAEIGEHAYVGPNATMCGRTRLLEGAHLGPNAVILDRKCVGRYAVVGIGSAVTKDVRDYSVVMGNPARRVSRVSREISA